MLWDLADIALLSQGDPDEVDDYQGLQEEAARHTMHTLEELGCN